jgi:hypothetical protein
MELARSREDIRGEEGLLGWLLIFKDEGELAEEEP